MTPSLSEFKGHSVIQKSNAKSFLFWQKGVLKSSRVLGFWKPKWGGLNGSTEKEDGSWRSWMLQTPKTDLEVHRQHWLPCVHICAHFNEKITITTWHQSTEIQRNSGIHWLFIHSPIMSDCCMTSTVQITAGVKVNSSEGRYKDHETVNVGLKGAT